jgi:hypothetical protein
MMTDKTARVQIRAVRVVGGGKPPAEISFAPGFNVISGASNTGKSYILQCIDYALGAGRAPKPIEESLGYESVQLDLVDTANGSFTLQRSLKGGDARISGTDANGQLIPPRLLAEKHSASDPETISGFFLQHTGLWDKKVRLNKEGALRSLSFRDLARLIIVDETRIISDTSPILTGQYTSAPVERSVFNLLITGVDDSSIIAIETKKDRRLRLKTQAEVLGRMIDKAERELQNIDSEPASLPDRKQTLDTAIRAHRVHIEESAEEINKQEQIRQGAWRSFQQAEAKRSSNEELLVRFNLLEQHYRNDIARLTAIVEADYFFRQLRQERCPLCGAPPESHDDTAACRPESPELANLREACIQETSKINVLLRDLVGTTSNIESDISRLTTEATGQRQIVNDAAITIKESLAPKAVSQQMELDNLYNTRTTIAEAAALFASIQEMRAERRECEVAMLEKTEEPKYTPALISQAVEGFTLEVQELLQSWSYPGLTRVTFSEEDADLIISGRRRATEGKGLRAISHAGFVIGLMMYCRQVGNPHSGFVVLDSPLVTYKRRDVEQGEAIPDDVRSAFFSVLSAMSPDAQIIVLENEDPPETIRARINYQHFSRSREIGRYGFFPVAQE